MGGPDNDDLHEGDGRFTIDTSIDVLTDESGNDHHYYDEDLDVYSDDSGTNGFHPIIPS